MARAVAACLGLLPSGSGVIETFSSHGKPMPRLATCGNPTAIRGKQCQSVASKRLQRTMQTRRGGHLFDELLDKLRLDRLMHHDELDGGAALRGTREI